MGRDVEMRVAALMSAALVLAVPRPAHAQGVASPHGALPAELTCTSCHGTEKWSPLRSDLAFDHGDTGFRLEGRHGEVACARCHTSLEFQRVATAEPGDCASCHLDVHEGTIARACAACHTGDSFAQLDYGVVHPADFPLEGAHLQTSCESCHTDDLGGAFRALDTDCASCHMGDYLTAPLVDHQRLGFSTVCSECHSSLDFRDVAFDHFVMSGGFELVGRHAGIECTACHSGAGGALPFAPASPDDCVACHRQDYDREHGGSGFPTDCLSCHNPFEWDGASFEHSFPIFSGAHDGEWDACADCHEVPGDFRSFTCLTCHRQPQMDDKHRDERGYAYESPTCLSCHPTGRGD
jgi:hypothetical protein